jgi:hypothetical protein
MEWDGSTERQPTCLCLHQSTTDDGAATDAYRFGAADDKYQGMQAVAVRPQHSRVGQLKKRKPQKSRQKGASPQINRSALMAHLWKQSASKDNRGPTCTTHSPCHFSTVSTPDHPHPFPVYLPSAKSALPWPRTDATLCCPFFLALALFEHDVHSSHGTEITSRAKGVTLWNGPELHLGLFQKDMQRA